MTNLYKPFILTCLACMTAITGWAQVTGDKYISEITMEAGTSPQYVSASNDGVSNNPPSNVLNGDDGDYWQISNNGDENNPGWIIIKLDDSRYSVCNQISFVLPGHKEGRNPKSLKVYSSSTNLSATDTGWGDPIASTSADIKVPDKSVSLDLANLSGPYIKIEVIGTSKEGGKEGEVDESNTTRISEIRFGYSSEPEKYSIDLTKISVNHKEAKWYSLANGFELLGTFDVKGETEHKMLPSGEKDANGGELEIQNTHVLEETIYVTKGSTTRLTLPDWLGNRANNRAYQRWYNYTTGGTFATGNVDDDDVQDLLTPPEITRWKNNFGNVPNNDGTAYRFANGYIGSPLSENPLYAMDFYFPANGSETEYVVACDVSGYTDYTSSFSPNTTSEFLNVDESGTVGDVYEPTLSHRFIYHIIAVDEEKNFPVEIMNITMPATRIPNMTEEMVALQHDARAYIPKGRTVSADNPLKVKIDEETNTAGISLCSEKGDNTYYIIDPNGDYAFVDNNDVRDPNEFVPVSDLEDERNDDFIRYRKVVNGENGVDYAPLVGESRVIHFNYPKTNEDGTMSVETSNGESRATIEVYSSNAGEEDILVAKFNLTFVEEDRLLSQSQVEDLDEMTDDDKSTATGWKELYYRTPGTLNKTYEKPLVELNFDYSTKVVEDLEYSASGFYTFPLAWSSSSYGFFDGGPDYTGNSSDVPEWGYYAITNKYLECGSWNTKFDDPNDAADVRKNSNATQSTYHLFADVSDRPGIIARLPFTENLCSGTELFVTAWVKSARGGTDRNNAAALFTIMGVTNEDDGTKTYTPIYRYQTGQIPTTYYNDKNVNLPGFNDSGTADATTASNEWMQAYFSFINSADQDFDSYALQIDNNSASTNGGDIYIDDIRVYIAPVNPEVTQLTTSCANGSDTDSERTRFNVDFNFERLVSRVGASVVADDDATTIPTTEKVAFCLIDKDDYDASIAAAVGDNPEEGEPTNEQIEAALAAAKRNIYVTEEDDGMAMPYITMGFSNKFSGNTVYKDNNEGLPVESDDSYAFYGRTVNGVNSLTTDFYADVEPNHKYYMLVANPGEESDLAMFAGFEDECAIKSDSFIVTPRNMIRINGEIVDPTLSRCANETYNFTAELRVPTGETNEDGQKVYEPLDPDVADVYFDWYFGTEADYTTSDPNFGDMTLETALATFRDAYPDATEITDGMIGEAGNDDLKNALKMVKHYAEEAEGAAEGQHPHPLVLHAKSVNITMLEGGLNLIAQPIRIDIDEQTLVCWDYIPLTLDVSNAAPTVKPGFNWIKYPCADDNDTDDYQNLDPCLRIGLAQMKSVSTQSGSNSLTIDLHNATFTDAEGATQLLQVSDEDKHIYLVSTDDPAYNDFFKDGAAFDQYSLPAGEITYFKGTKYVAGNTSSDQNWMKLQFDLTTEKETDLTGDDGSKLKFKFEPKEGYTYNFAVHFVEADASGKAIEGPCPGHFILPVKVVPEYVKWEGSADGEGNWNNDSNWKRVSDEEMNMDVPATPDENLRDDVTFTNEAGFVPMLFTKVIMPKDSKVKLYRAGYNNNSWELGGPNDQTDSPDLPKQKPTLNIQYDLMAYGNESEETGDIVTQLYRVNLCDEIHFEPGAEMLRPEYLLYNKAWIDMEVPAGEWTLVSTPLQDVVSGDWFTTTDGKQATKYFADIKFADGYNRLKPFVTQRTWTDGANIVGAASDGVDTPVDTPVSFTATWSALFNDTSVPYAAGNGYSVKTASISSSGTSDAQAEKFETLTFRFPKADTQYDMSSSTISRTNTGRLVTDGILKRTNTNVSNNVIEKEYIKEADDIDGITLKNIAERTDGGTTKKYAIVGNPFMANLDVSKFIEKNSDVLEPKYWTDSDVNGTEAGTATQNGTEWSWNENSNGLVGQYKAFCVELKYGATPVVKFTPDMAVLTSSTDETTETTNLVITAKSADATSTAALAYDAQANDGYVSAEDAELITDLLGNGNNLSVYTVADNTAVSVNKIKDLRLIPVGLFADDKDVTKVTFTGVAALLEPTLYDAETNTETPLTEGYTLTIDGESHGRYFIRTRGAGEGTTDIEETVADGGNSVSVYSVEPGKVVVASSASLKDVMIYSVGGTLLKHESVGSGLTTCTVDNVDSGVVIVKVVTSEGTTTKKIAIK